jgi:dihydrodipicolinate synthase/N-acetylneuraminate lyase
MLLNGIFAAITTPFDADGRLYLKKLEHNVDRYTGSPISGLVVLGSTGEAVMLNGAEQRELFRTAIAAAAPQKVMIAGCGHESVQETLEFCEYVAALGYHVALVRTPHYYRAQMTPAAMLNYFRTVADRSPLPVLLYSFPQCTGYDLPVEVVAELAEHRNILGIKESSGDLAKVERMVQRTSHIEREGRTTDGFQTVVGSGHKMHALLNAGAVGGILAFAACAPTACYEIYAAFNDHDPKLAAEKQQRIAAACIRIVSELGIAGVKYASDLNGFYGGNPRLPLLPLTAAERHEIESLMAKLKS